MHVATISIATVDSKNANGTLDPANDAAIGVLKYSAAVGAYVAVAIAITSVAVSALRRRVPGSGADVEVIAKPPVAYRLWAIRLEK